MNSNMEAKALVPYSVITNVRVLIKQLDLNLKIGIIVVLVICIVSLIGIFTGTGPYDMDISNRLLPPGEISKYPLGTDGLGRSLFARLSLGFFVSLFVSVSAVLLAAGIGILTGLFAGYSGKVIDTLLMRITDIQMAFPFIILAVSVLSVTRPTFLNVILVLALVTWPIYARMLRSMVLVEKEKDYIKVIKTLGASRIHILFKNIAPNRVPGVLAVMPLDIAVMIILEAILGFLGIGIQPPTPSWGNIMADGRPYLVNAWWVATLPGIWILITIFGINLIGMSLQKIYGVKR